MIDVEFLKTNPGTSIGGIRVFEGCNACHEFNGFQFVIKLDDLRFVLCGRCAMHVHVLMHHYLKGCMEHAATVGPINVAESIALLKDAHA